MPRRALLIIIAVTFFSLASDASAQAVASAHAPSARIAFFDAEAMTEAGVKFENPVVASDLSTFADGLNVKLCEVSRLMGSIFLTDESLDITEDFISAFKAKPSRKSRIVPPARQIPDATIAFIDTDAFNDPARGVTRLLNVSETIEREFAPRREEIRKLKERLAAASGNEKKRLESEINKKAMSGQEDIQRRWKEMSEPVFQDIQAGLKSFCKREGISVLFDLSKVKPGDKLAPYDLPLPADTLDVTAAFVSAFNKGTL